jgi:hypothetical protein
MGVDEPANDIQLSSAEAVAASQLDRFEPKLAGAVLSLDVHVRRLVAVEAGEENPVRPRDALDSWHSEMFAPLPVRSAMVPGEPGRCLREQAADRWKLKLGFEPSPRWTSFTSR